MDMKAPVLTSPHNNNYKQLLTHILTAMKTMKKKARKIPPVRYIPPRMPPEKISERNQLACGLLMEVKDLIRKRYTHRFYTDAEGKAFDPDDFLGYFHRFGRFSEKQIRYIKGVHRKLMKYEKHYEEFRAAGHLDELMRLLKEMASIYRAHNFGNTRSEIALYSNMCQYASSLAAGKYIKGYFSVVRNWLKEPRYDPQRHFPEGKREELLRRIEALEAAFDEIKKVQENQSKEASP